MDIQCNVETLKSMVKKCKMEIVTDLILHANETGLFARFSDANSTMYCEVYETKIKLAQAGAGSIRIPSLKMFLNSLERIESDVCRLISDDTKFVISDGSQAGKSRIILKQVDEDFITSNQRIKGKLDILNKEKMLYACGQFQATEGFEVNTGVLQTILKDAKAFDIERYRFSMDKDLFKCVIENVAVGDTFTRFIPTVNKIGKGTIPTVIVGAGFREIVNAIATDKELKNVSMYVHDMVIILTDNATFYHCLNTLEN